MKSIRLGILILSRISGWSRAEVRGLSWKEYTAYLELAPETVKMTGIDYGT